MSTWTEKDQRLFEKMRDGGRLRESVGDQSRRGKPFLSRHPDLVPDVLEDRSLDQLQRQARELSIAGRSRMTKEQLVSAIRRKF